MALKITKSAKKTHKSRLAGVGKRLWRLVVGEREVTVVGNGKW